MIAPSQVRFALVGAGAIAQSYAQAFASSRETKLVAVADVRPEAAQALARQAGCESFDSYEALARDVECDAVVVCTPPTTHPEICTFFLEQGRHVLCEKPFAIEPASAWSMLEVARRHGMRLTMASKFRYVEDVVRARKLVTDGVVGEIVLFENAFTSQVNMANRWNSRPEISGGGVLIDNGTHSVDILRYFLGPLAELQVVEGKRVQELLVEDTVRIFARSSSGVMCSIDLSWSINKELPSYINIYGSRGTILVGWKESKYRLANSQEWTVFGTGYDKVQAFRGQIDNFARAIRDDEPLLITGEDALASVDAIEAAYNSLYQNHWIAVSRQRGSRPRTQVAQASGA